MDDLVKRLRKYGGAGRGADHPQNIVCREAADRIEQLERELAVMVKAQEANLQSLADTEAELAAEKALADSFSPYRIGSGPSTDMSMLHAAQAELRKARGL